MTSDAALQTLANLLQGANARPDVHPSRLARSAVYDLQYRVFIVAAVFEIHAKPYLDKRRINTAKLKLLQFIAVRPWLVPVIRAWSQSQGYAQQSMLSPQQLRRGFLGDTMHDDVVRFLVARGVFSRMPSHLVSSENWEMLRRLYIPSLEHGQFAAAITALQELKTVTITNDMLEGW